MMTAAASNCSDVLSFIFFLFFFGSHEFLCWFIYFRSVFALPIFGSLQPQCIFDRVLPCRCTWNSWIDSMQAQHVRLWNAFRWPSTAIRKRNKFVHNIELEMIDTLMFSRLASRPKHDSLRTSLLVRSSTYCHLSVSFGLVQLKIRRESAERSDSFSSPHHRRLLLRFDSIGIEQLTLQISHTSYSIPIKKRKKSNERNRRRRKTGGRRTKFEQCVPIAKTNTTFAHQTVCAHTLSRNMWCAPSAIVLTAEWVRWTIGGDGDDEDADEPRARAHWNETFLHQILPSGFCFLVVSLALPLVLRYSASLILFPVGFLRFSVSSRSHARYSRIE